MRSNKLRYTDRDQKFDAPTPTLSPSTGILHFDANRIVAGIRFHVTDAGLATGLTDDSVRRATTRLTRDATDLTIHRERWEAMDDRERLHWLLSESHTALSLAEGAEGLAVLHREGPTT